MCTAPCSKLLGVTTDPAHLHALSARDSTPRASIKRGERLVRAHLKASGTLLAAADGDDALRSSFGSRLGASIGSLGFGQTCTSLSTGLCAGYGGAEALSPALLPAELVSDDESDGEPAEGGRRACRDSGIRPSSRPTRGGSGAWSAPGACGRSSGGRLGGSNGGGRGDGRGSGSSQSGRSRCESAARVWWSTLVASHGGSASTGDDEESEMSSGGDDELGTAPRWAPVTWATARRGGRHASTPSAKQPPSAKREWDSIRGATGGTGLVAAQRWCELTVCTGDSYGGGSAVGETGLSAGRTESSADYHEATEQPDCQWRQLRAQVGS